MHKIVLNYWTVSMMGVSAAFGTSALGSFLWSGKLSDSTGYLVFISAMGLVLTTKKAPQISGPCSKSLLLLMNTATAYLLVLSCALLFAAISWNLGFSVIAENSFSVVKTMVGVTETCTYRSTVAKL